MKRRRRLNKLKFFIFLISMVAMVVTIFLLVKPSALNDTFEAAMGHPSDPSTSTYSGKSLLVTDRETNEVYTYNQGTEILPPASLTKLYVIDYAMSLCELEEEVMVDAEAMGLVKPYSSMASIQNKVYTVENLVAGMLVPSGNDATYALASYVGGKLNNRAATAEERIRSFLEGLNSYLKRNGFTDTVIYDPSGYDYETRTSVADLKRVTDHLLESQWFRDTVSQHTYTAYLPDGSFHEWENTNEFLDPESPYYNINVKGVKTGSLEYDYHLVVLYQQHGKEYLIISLGSASDELRNEDVTFVLRTIDREEGFK